MEGLNPCKNLECNSCCSQMLLRMTISEFSIFIGDNKYVAIARKGDLEALCEVENLTYGVYMFSNNNRYTHDALQSYRTEGVGGDSVCSVLLPNDCVNLVNGECDIYDMRPNACRNFKFDGHQCVLKRSQKNSLIVI